MRGDLLFYPSSGSLIDRIITIVTHGPFVHVAVDMGLAGEISAHSEDGVCRRPIPDDLPKLPSYSLANTNTLLGINFLKEQIGKKYSYANGLNVVLKWLRIPWRIYHAKRFNCSSLVAHYLEHVGIDLSDDDEALSPNDLARALGVLKL